MGSAHRQRMVYVVDADAAVRQAIARVLEASGLHACPCESIGAFLESRTGDTAACLVLDLSRATREQSDVQGRLRREATDVPIIAVSASDDDGARRAARNLGAQAFFRKPVDGAALVDFITWVTRADAGPATH